MVETEGRWPDQFRVAKATCLAKTADAEPFADPLKQRILLVTHSVYRLWARCRLSQIDRWTERWAQDEMFAGIPGRSAEDAWYTTALDIEATLLEGSSMSGGSADVRKCFDQILRPLMYELLRKSGLPNNILLPYKDMLEHLQVVKNISGHVGEVHAHPCGIP